jgi:hypothetical protein
MQMNLLGIMSVDFDVTDQFFFPLALQPQFGPWPTSVKLSVSFRFTRS